MGPVNLEEFLAIDCAPDGVLISPALHYNEGTFLGNVLVDQIMKETA